MSLNWHYSSFSFDSNELPDDDDELLDDDDDEDEPLYNLEAVAAKLNISKWKIK